MWDYKLEERGVSSVVAFLLIMSALIAFGGYALAVKGRQAGTRASGLVDAMRQAEKRQQQLLTFVHAYENCDRTGPAGSPLSWTVSSQADWGDATSSSENALVTDNLSISKYWIESFVDSRIYSGEDWEVAIDDTASGVSDGFRVKWDTEVRGMFSFSDWSWHRGHVKCVADSGESAQFSERYLWSSHSRIWDNAWGSDNFQIKVRGSSGYRGYTRKNSIYYEGYRPLASWSSKIWDTGVSENRVFVNLDYSASAGSDENLYFNVSSYQSDNTLIENSGWVQDESNLLTAADIENAGGTVPEGANFSLDIKMGTSDATHSPSVSDYTLNVRPVSSGGKLQAYFYNYGTRKINVDKLWVNGALVPPLDLDFEADNRALSGDIFYPRKLTTIAVKNIRFYAPPSLDNYAFTFLTESNSLYSYLVGRG